MTTPRGFSHLGYTPPVIARPALISEERVRGAGVLMLLYQYGIRLRFFEAIERARAMIGTDQLCMDTAPNDVIDRLYCYPGPHHRAGPSDLTALAASVLGISAPEESEEQRDPLIRGMLTDLLDALNDACDGLRRTTGQSAAELQRLESAALAVQARFSASMSGFAGLQVRDLQSRFDDVTTMLTELAQYLTVPCRPGAGGARDLWGSVAVLVGDDLRADGIDLFGAARTADAWHTVFEALDGPPGGRPATDDLCRAAALLRPRSRRQCHPCAEKE